MADPRFPVAVGLESRVRAAGIASYARCSPWRISHPLRHVRGLDLRRASAPLVPDISITPCLLGHLTASRPAIALLFRLDRLIACTAPRVTRPGKKSMCI